MFVLHGFVKYVPSIDYCRPLKKYSSDYLRSFRYRNRSYNKFDFLEVYLQKLGIFKYFNTKRGSTAGNRLKSSSATYVIKSITSKVRRSRPLMVEPRPSYLVAIPTQRYHYEFPSLFVTNLRSISNKFEQLCISIDVYKPSIILLSETWINTKNKEAYLIDGFNAFHRIRERDDKTHGGGISVYIRKDISIHQQNLSPYSKVEVMSIMCKPNYLPRNIPWIAFILVYFPPNDDNENEVLNFILTEYDRLMAINSKAGIFIAGDFNSMDIKTLLRLPGFVQLNNTPTRGSRCLDICISNLQSHFSYLTLPPIAGSDHNLLFITPLQSIIPKSSNIIVTYRKRSNSAYSLMANVLSHHDWSQWALIDSVQIMADLFYDFINYLFHISFPLVTENRKINSHPWMNREIAILIKKRDVLALQSNVDSAQFSLLCKQIKDLITKAKNEVCRNLLFKYKSSPSDFYNMIKSLTNCRTVKSNVDMVFPGSNAEETKASICEYFNNLLNIHPRCSLDYESFYVGNATLPKIELFDVYRMLKKLPNNNACAPGDVPSHIYRELSEFLAEPLHILFNCSLSNSFVPSQWKSGFLITIPKVPNVTSPSQLRPIMITSPVGKILERHILSIIKKDCKGLIDPMQFGGLQCRSTCHYLSVYVHRVLMQLESRGSSVTTIFTDYAKAFDSVDHGILIDAMVKLSINPAAIKWVLCFLDKRLTTLRDGNYSNNLSFSSSCGIPQGSVLGGFLFLIVVNDLMSTYPLRLKYMDDLTISVVNISETPSLIQNVIDDLVLQSDNLKIKLNINKCVLMHHSFSKLPKAPSAAVGDSQLSLTSSFRLLGVYVQDDLRWGSQVGNMIIKANRKLHMLYMLRRIGAPKDVLCDTYTTYIRPILEYCCPVWHPALTKAQSRSLELFQGRVVRIIVGKNHSSYTCDLNLLNLTTLESRRVQLHSKFAERFFIGFPEFLPKTVFQTTGVQTRRSNQYAMPTIRTNRAHKSPIVSFINVLNSNI